MFCSNCGKPTAPSYQFCSNCGQKIIKTNVSSKTLALTNDLGRPNSPKINLPSSVKNLPLQPKENFLIRHWRGELSLATSTWLIGVFLHIITIMMSNILLKSNLSATFYIFMYLGFSILSVWQLIGIWRSSEVYIKKGGNNIWASLVKLFVVFGWISIISVFSRNVPLYYEAIVSNPERENIPEIQFRFINNNKELLVEGGIGIGAAKEFKKVANANSSLKIIHLNNNGGLIDEATNIYSFIKKKGYSTYTSKECISACTIMFLAGEDRLLAKGAKLGFHSASIGKYDGADYDQINLPLKEIYKVAGLSDTLIHQALSTPQEEIFYPSQQNLVSNNAVDYIVNKEDYGSTSLTSYLSNQKIDALLMEIEPYPALKLNFPEEYNAFKKKIFSLADDGVSLIKIRQEGENFFDKLVSKLVMTADDKSVNEYIKAVYKSLSYFRKADPSMCNVYLFPDKFEESKKSAKLPKNLSKGITEAIEAMILSKSEENSYIDELLMQSILEKSTLKVLEDNPSVLELFTDDVLSITNPSGCKYILATYNELWHAAGSRRAEAFRFLLNM